jgi:hypothetical protein
MINEYHIRLFPWKIAPTPAPSQPFGHTQSPAGSGERIFFGIECPLPGHEYGSFDTDFPGRGSRTLRGPWSVAERVRGIGGNQRFEVSQPI